MGASKSGLRRGTDFFGVAGGREGGVAREEELLFIGSWTAQHKTAAKNERNDGTKKSALHIRYFLLLSPSRGLTVSTVPHENTSRSMHHPTTRRTTF